ncbi:AMME chromosomal region protein 1-like [Mortierella sp. GBA43]|nr:AMME chromosomal region protein 1-like [Mortierella sp. GBA43]
MSKEHCFYCFDALVAHFEARPVHKPDFDNSEYPFAFKDGRFPPIAKKELVSLVCNVSLLTDFEDGKDYLDWEIGVHGIWIEFSDDNGRKKTATYLPEVAKEQGWTKKKAIHSLLRKGGFRGSITDDVMRAIVLTRYQSRKAQATYEEYTRSLE